MKIVTAEEMRAIDLATTEKHGVPSLTLMENAGAAVAEFAQKHFDFKTVCVVCGKGNNGGDGFVAARKLREAGKQVSVLVLAKGADDLRGDAAEMFKKLAQKLLWISGESDFKKPEIEQALKADLIVDAILGTGFKPPLKGIAQKSITLMNKASGWVLAVDLPSGVDADNNEPPESSAVFVHADGIVSFTAPKPALVFGNLTDGPIAVVAIGSPPGVVAKKSSLREHILTSADVQAFSVSRRHDANKGDFGHVLIVGGSVGKSGAAAMAGLAALRAGAGLVTVACPKSVQPLVAAYAPELMTEPLEETSEGTVSLLALANRERWLAGKSVVVVGPGISRNKETAEFVRDLVSICSQWVVIDADGLNAFENQKEEIQPDKDVNPLALRVLTPHPGEMSRLAGIPTLHVQENRIATALKIAAETNSCVVLKGDRTVVASPEGYTWINTTGNPGMAKGGSGDVLSGIIAGMLSQWPSEVWHASSTPEWGEPTSVVGNLEQQTFARLLSKQDPDAAKIRELAEKHRKTQDSAYGNEIRFKIEEKSRQAFVLLNCLAVGKAVYLHGLAGDIARDLYGENSMIATDIIHCLGEAFALCEEESHSKFAYLQR